MMLDNHHTTLYARASILGFKQGKSTPDRYKPSWMIFQEKIQYWGREACLR